MQYKATIIITVDGTPELDEVREAVEEVCMDETNLFVMGDCGVEAKRIEFHSLEVIG